MKRVAVLEPQMIVHAKHLLLTWFTSPYPSPILTTWFSTLTKIDPETKNIGKNQFFEVFESFGIADELLRAAYHVLEVTFWSANASGNLVRTSRTADLIPGLSHQPHLILNQASINRFLLDAMHDFNGQEVSYGYTVEDIRVDTGTSTQIRAYPVEVTATKEGKQEIFKAKYVLVW